MGLSGEVVWALMLLCGLQWHALDRTEQAKYYEMAREERAKHMQVRKLGGCVWKWLDSRAMFVQMYPGWSARDNYAIHKKRRKRKVKQVESKGDEIAMDEDKGKDGECVAT